MFGINLRVRIAILAILILFVIVSAIRRKQALGRPAVLPATAPAAATK